MDKHQMEMAMTSDTDEDQLDLAIDWGTYKFVVGFTVSRNGVRSAPKPLMINERTFEVRMMATWIDGRFVHGHELQQLSAKRKDLKIIDFFKLPLYRGPETSEITRKVEATLAALPGTKTLDMLITEHLAAVVEDAKTALRKSPLKVDYRDDPEKLERLLENIRVRITIPQMWTPDAKRRMQTAAKEAGIRVAVLSYEPQCALAYLIDMAAQSKVQIGPLKKGDSILVADLGSGTGDFVRYRLEDDLSIDSRLKCMGRSSGEICGSFKVDEALLENLKRRQGTEWYEKVRARLDLDADDFERRVLVAIEEAKQKFGRDDEDFTTANINGVGGEFQSFQFRRVDFYEAFEPVVAKIVAEIDKHSERVMPTVIQITGGFSKCRYLMDKLRHRYEKLGSIVVRPYETDTGDSFPVVLGALLRYSNITIPRLPSQYGYAIRQREVFDEDLHVEAYSVTEDFDGSLDYDYKPWVQFDPYDDEVSVVDDRLRTIIQMDQVLDPGETVVEKVTHNYWIPCDNPHITIEAVYLTKKFDDHMWAMKETDVEDVYVFRAGVHPWASVEIPIDKGELEGKGFKEVVQDGKKYWKLEVQVTLQNAESAVQIGVWVMKPPAFTGKAEPGLPRGVAFKVKETLWEATHSPFVL